MANPVKGEADIKLADGRELRLVFDANAWCEIEDALGGRPTQDILADLQAKPPRAGLKVQRAIMWGGLRKHQPDLTIQEAGDILVEASEQLAKAMKAAMPLDDPSTSLGTGGEAGEDSEEGPPKPRRGAGTKP